MARNALAGDRHPSSGAPPVAASADQPGLVPLAHAHLGPWTDLAPGPEPAADSAAAEQHRCCRERAARYGPGPDHHGPAPDRPNAAHAEHPCRDCPRQSRRRNHRQSHNRCRRPNPMFPRNDHDRILGRCRDCGGAPAAAPDSPANHHHAPQNLAPQNLAFPNLGPPIHGPLIHVPPNHGPPDDVQPHAVAAPQHQSRRPQTPHDTPRHPRRCGVADCHPDPASARDSDPDPDLESHSHLAPGPAPGSPPHPLAPQPRRNVDSRVRAAPQPVGRSRHNHHADPDPGFQKPRRKNNSYLPTTFRCRQPCVVSFPFTNHHQYSLAGILDHRQQKTMTNARRKNREQIKPKVVPAGLKPNGSERDLCT